MMVAFFGLFVVLALLVIDIALEQGIFGSTGRLVQIMPAVLGTTLFPSVETFAFGGALGMLIAIFAGWLGGLLAASRITTTVTGTPVPVRTTPVVEQQTVISTEVHPARGRFRLLSSAGRKGGEPVQEAKVPENKTGRADRTEPR